MSTNSNTSAKSDISHIKVYPELSSHPKITRLFSGTLFMRDLKSQAVLIVCILLIMMLMCAVLSVAAHAVESDRNDEALEDTQETFFTYLAGLAAYNETIGNVMGIELSCDDFLDNADRDAYESAFDFINDNLSFDETLTVDGFSDTLDAMQESDIDLDAYISEFEYVYALSHTEGVFSGNDLDVEDMMKTTLELMGVSNTIVETMSEMDTSSLINTMYFKVTGLLPILLLVVLMGNFLFASQVDKGSMAYLLSTPITRRAVVVTQTAFMLVVPLILVAVTCVEKIAVVYYLSGEANIEMLVSMYVGWYLLAEAMGALCYFGSCLFNTSSRSLAFGGGLAVWFFIASFLAIFGGSDLVNMGVGVKELEFFNNLTLTGLFDINTITTIGTDAVDYSFVCGFGMLAAVACVFYFVGSAYFCWKDLPL